MKFDHRLSQPPAQEIRTARTTQAQNPNPEPKCYWFLLPWALHLTLVCTNIYNTAESAKKIEADTGAVANALKTIRMSSEARHKLAAADPRLTWLKFSSPQARARHRVN